MSTERPVLLAVDDEPEILDLIETVLGKVFMVRRALGAEAALKALHHKPATVLLTDQRMPQTSGLELLARVAEEYPDTARVLVSGFADLPRITRAIGEGLVHGYAVKPLDPTRLREAVEEAMARRREGEWA